MLDPLGLACSTPDGIASVRQLFLIRAEHVIDIPEPDPDTYTVDTISIAPATAFVEYEFEPDQIGFFTTPQLGPSGTSYTHTITTLRQGLSRAVADEIQKLIGGGYVAIIRTFEEQVLTVGTPAAPLIFRYEFTSGPVRNDTHTNAWKLESVSDRPAFHMAGNVEPPDEQVVPFAKLTVTESGTDSFRIRANGSRYASGTLITTLSGGISLRYTFTIGILSFTATISPGSSATTAANWTVTSGSSVEFASFISGYIASGTGFDFTFRPFYWGVRFPESLMNISLQVIEGSLLSNIDTQAALMYSYAADIDLDTTRTTSFTTSLRSSVAGGTPVIIDYGDGQLIQYSITTTLSNQVVTLASGTKRVRLFAASPTSIREFRCSSMSVTYLAAYQTLTTLTHWYNNSNNIANTLDLRGTNVQNLFLGTNTSPTYEVNLVGQASPIYYDIQGVTATRTIDLSNHPALQYYYASTGNINTVKGSTNTALRDFFATASKQAGSISFAECTLMQRIVITNTTTFTGLVLGTSHVGLNRVEVSGCSLATTELNALVDMMWVIRSQNPASGKLFRIQTNPGTLSATSLDKINGTGAFAGDGLANHRWTTTL